jgi:hypothetical protein
MAKSSPKRRAAVRSAKRARTNQWWYWLTAIILIAGVGLIVYVRATEAEPEGPYVLDQVNQTNPHNKDSHWHAALGVYDCDHWLGDGTGDGVWAWPAATPSGSPARFNNTNIYAGLHSHADGIIHMEPQVNEEAGKNATIGKYFEFGGWDVSSSGYDFLGTKRQNGDKCGDKPGKLSWGVAQMDPTASDATTKKYKFDVRDGDPGSFKLTNDNIVVIAFLPEGKTIADIGNPPSVAKLPDAPQNETPVGQMPSVTTTVPGETPDTAPGTTTPPTTAKP